MIVVVFENELKAYDGSRALKELHSEDSISIHGEAVIKKNEDGTVTVKQEADDFPIRTVGGTAVGSLIGLLGGPVGVAVGAVAGTFTGGILDMYRAGVNADFLDDVSAKLTPGKWAIVADVSEEWETPIDTRMAALGGTVFREIRYEIEDEQDKRDVAAIEANIAQLKKEQAQSRADQKAKIQSKIDGLNKKLHAKLEQAKNRRKRREEEGKAKVEALEKKASKAKGEAKAKIEERIDYIKKKEKEGKENFKRWLEAEGEIWI
jgi:uncharacterized membrane protein